MDRAVPCPDESTLLDFVEGVLSGPQRATVDAHLEGCSTCLDLVALLARSADADEGSAPERYTLRREVGSGGMGRVFEAFDSVLGRVVALKCVRAGPEDEAAAQRFEREMALTARLQHPSIIPVYDAGAFPDGSRYFAMRLVDGRTLDAATEDASSFRERLALVPGLRRACEAVAYAHEQSVIHRDLKPANILIGPFGETVVLDWGLAKRVSDVDPRGERQQPESSDEGMTRPGAVMGTPGYIAPEVSRGEPAGPRSDVFSLGKILETLIRPDDAAAGGAELLADARAIIDKATAPDEATRYPTASELCDDVRRFEAGQTISARDYSLGSRVRRFTREHRRPIVVSMLFVGVGGVAGLGAATALEDRGPDPCSGAREALAGVWDEGRRNAVRDAFMGTNLAYAPLALSRTVQVLETYADAWVAMHTASCEATARGEQSAALLDLRGGCLDQARLQLQAAVDVLAEADTEVLENADEVTQRLPRLERCADQAGLEAAVEPPRDEDVAPVERTRASLARARALLAAGRPEGAATALADSRTASEGVEYPPLLTELALGEGSLFEARGDYEEAEEAFTVVLREGTRLGQREAVREAALGMMFVVGIRQVKPAEGLRYRQFAEALSTSPSAEADFRDRLGAVLDTQGNYAQAAEEHRAALTLRQQLGDDAGVATARNNYAIVLDHLGDPEAAEREIRAALAARLESLGPDHPKTAETRVNLAYALLSLGRPADAETEARASLEVQLKTRAKSHYGIVATRIALGRALAAQGKVDDAKVQYQAALEVIEPDHAQVVTLRHSLGTILVAQRAYAEAADEFRAALELLESTWGPDHRRQVPIRIGLAAVLFYQEDYAQAEVQFRRVLDIASRSTKPNPLEVASARNGLSQALQGQGKREEAMAEMLAVRAIYEDALEPEHPLIATTNHNLAEALLDAGRADEALPLIETAWARRQRDDIPAVSRANTAFLFAKIVWSRDRPRARTLAQAARTTYDAAGDASAKQAVESWLRAHGD